MGSLYLLIPVSLIFCVIALVAYFWAVNSGQYDDLDGEGERLLFDHDDKPQKGELKQNDNKKNPDEQR
ncbi:MAG: cbb3-type cytochrome oxidase assembly protein CcoS [Porticoccaceae bacterium]|nr:cbb3-type cytochrome oxidase assembly protein CcoS [Pseudomonadales bacterium]MCP5173161.1 cbb3-type cytochrome oxidase assembly protein CcoS [Pseudomonadales bacterium]